MTVDFDNYAARVASGNAIGNSTFHSVQEKNLLQESVHLLEELGGWWTNIFHHQKAFLQIKLDSQAPAKCGAYASSAKQNQFSITITIEFVHHLVREGTKNMASLQGYDGSRSVLSAVTLILFHELAHVIFGHTESDTPKAQDYRTDETSADFRSGMLFVKSAIECSPFRTRLNSPQPDDLSRYACVGALLLQRYLHQPGARLTHYHGPNNRFNLICAGYMYMAAATGTSTPDRLQPILEILEKTARASRDSGWRHILQQDIDDNLQMLSTTIPDYHARADKYDEQSIIGGTILRLIKGTNASLDAAAKRIRKFFGNESEHNSTSDANAHRDALRRIIHADNKTRASMDLNSVEGEIMIVEFGRRGDLTDEQSNEAAEFMVRVARVRPNILISIAVGGFDNDPRRVTDIPECADHFRRLYLALKNLGPEGDAVFAQLETQSRALLKIAMGYAPRGSLIIKPEGDIRVKEQFWHDLLRIRGR